MEVKKVGPKDYNSPALKKTDEKGYDAVSGDLLVAIDPKYYRPTEVEFLLGDASKARQDLNWSPKITLQELVSEMVDYDMHFDGYGGQL